MKTKLSSPKLTKNLWFQLILLLLCFQFDSCKRKHHSQSSQNERIEQVIKVARTYTGTPYKFGGNNKLGIDCSGLLHSAFLEIGIEIPRTTKEQVEYGKPIEMKDLQAGDWVFFTDKQGSSKITHVGMVTEVHAENDLKFIHAGNKLGVTEEQLYLNYWQKVYLKAIRPQCFVE